MLIVVIKEEKEIARYRNSYIPSEGLWLRGNENSYQVIKVEVDYQREFCKIFVQ